MARTLRMLLQITVISIEYKTVMITMVDNNGQLCVKQSVFVVVMDTSFLQTLRTAYDCAIAIGHYELASAIDGSLTPEQASKFYTEKLSKKYGVSRCC